MLMFDTSTHIITFYFITDYYRQIKYPKSIDYVLPSYINIIGLLFMLFK